MWIMETCIEPQPLDLTKKSPPFITLQLSFSCHGHYGHVGELKNPFFMVYKGEEIQEREQFPQSLLPNFHKPE